MVTLCIYYGEKEWDGPLSLVDMLDIPDKLKFIFSDYKFSSNPQSREPDPSYETSYNFVS